MIFGPVSVTRDKCGWLLRWSQQCEPCKGTGIYVGMAERDGSGVVCHKCSGSGRSSHEVCFAEFGGRKKRYEVRRVYQTNPGIYIGENSGKGLSLEDFGGIDYEEWLAGKAFSLGTEDRQHTCPAWFYQSADEDKMPDWKECCFGQFSNCEHFANRGACWRRFDEEQQ